MTAIRIRICRRSSTCCRRPRRSANDGHPRWFILTGLIHDLGKILCLFGEPQWAVVGDTFPVGCAYSDRIVFPEFFADNPDSNVARVSDPTMAFTSEGCGLDNVHLSWGHDEYLYHVVKDYLPEEALYMIRYHSFYPWHREGAYMHLMNEQDREMYRVGQAVQSVRSVFQGNREAGRREAQAVLSRVNRRVFSGRFEVVAQRPAHRNRPFSPENSGLTAEAQRTRRKQQNRRV